MSEDRTRSTGYPDVPSYGRVGPVDPREDPATRPAMPLPGPAQPDLPPAERSVLERSAPDLPARGVSPVDDTVPVADEGATVRTPLPGTLTPGPEAPTVATPTVATPAGDRPAPGLRHSRAGGLWTGLIASAVVLILLLVFILQNGAPVVINFLGFSGSLPTGVALLFAAVAGLLLVAIPGGLRMLQLRRAARRGERR
jgi:uncharacterized integral membrane protein